jgi:hypothetical protein
LAKIGELFGNFYIPLDGSEADPTGKLAGNTDATAVAPITRLLVRVSAMDAFLGPV